MTALWSSEAAAQATGGQATAPFHAHGISIDTRSIEPGDLFVALKDQRDGHDFVADAFARGASAAIVTHRPDGVSKDAPLLVVPDVLEALWALGRAGRARMTGTVVAITGSVGKTSTKEMLRAALQGQGRVHAAEKSFNNHWGVPLTLARMPAETDVAVIEIGMNAPGEIAPLTRLARPHIAIVTSVAAAHLEAFGRIEGIAHEKASIFVGLEPGGVAIYNADVETAPILAETASRHAGTVLGFGETPDAAIRLADLKLTDSASVAHAEIDGARILYKIAAPGRHFATNALPVLAVAHRLGVDLDVAISDLGRWRPVDGRGTRETIVLDPVEELSIDLVDDAFNANPASMAAALEVLAALTPRDGVGRVAKGRRIAILGDMLELGPAETELHRAIASHPGLDAVALVHCVGPRMRALWEALPEPRRGRWEETADALAARAHTLVDAGDVILVKGSKGSHVSRVVTAIRKLGQVRPALDTGEG